MSPHFPQIAEISLPTCPVFPVNACSADSTLRE
jgi:hypothetical protein